MGAGKFSENSFPRETPGVNKSPLFTSSHRRNDLRGRSVRKVVWEKLGNSVAEKTSWHQLGVINRFECVGRISNCNRFHLTYGGQLFNRLAFLIAEQRGLSGVLDSLISNPFGKTCFLVTSLWNGDLNLPLTVSCLLTRSRRWREFWFDFGCLNRHSVIKRAEEKK